MKKYFLLLLSISYLSARSQTVDEVIQKYTTAMGGSDSISKIKTAKMTGTLSLQGMEAPITVIIVNGKAVRTDLEIMGQSVVNVYKDGKGWKINPFQGAAIPTDMTPAELADIKQQSRLVNQLMDYKARGHEAILVTPESIDGNSVHVIRLTNKEDGKLTTYYIDTKTSLLVKSVTTREIMGQETEIETFFLDTREINGLKFSMHRIQKMEGQVLQEVKFEKIELNIPVDEKIFEK
jgi:hypothetical protein